MSWIIHVLVAAVALAAADVFVKLAAGRLPNSLGMLLYGGVAFGIGLIWFALDSSRATGPRATGAGIAYALAVGVAFSIVTFALYAAFRSDAPLSLVSPAVRLGGLIVASACGVLLWHEPITLRYVLGMALAVTGVFLVVTR